MIMSPAAPAQGSKRRTDMAYNFASAVKYKLVIFELRFEKKDWTAGSGDEELLHLRDNVRHGHHKDAVSGSHFEVVSRHYGHAVSQDHARQ